MKQSIILNPGNNYKERKTCKSIFDDKQIINCIRLNEKDSGMVSGLNPFPLKLYDEDLLLYKNSLYDHWPSANPEFPDKKE